MSGLRKLDIYLMDQKKYADEKSSDCRIPSRLWIMHNYLFSIEMILKDVYCDTLRQFISRSRNSIQQGEVI